MESYIETGRDIVLRIINIESSKASLSSNEQNFR